VLVDGKVYVFTRQKDDEIVFCFDVASGKQVWRSEPCPAPYVPGPAAPGDNKPRSTPAVAGGRVFTLGVGGILSCLDARTGKLLWRRASTGCPGYGASASPLVIDGLCIVHVGGQARGSGGLTAFDAATGEAKWCFDNVIGPAYASPIVADLAGQRQVVTFTQGSLVGVSVTTGKQLWGVHCPRFDLEKCVTPVLYKDLILFADSFEPLRSVRLEKSESGLTAKEVWKSKGSPLHMSSPVVAGDWVLGFSGQNGGHLFCLDAKTGETLWRSDGRMGAYASILRAGGLWLVLTDRGQFLVVKPNGTAYEPVARYQVSDSPTWAHPLFLGDRLLIKDATLLRSFRIESDPAK
jgi:outer membrane protein assembly factor BamB